MKFSVLLVSVFLCAFFPETFSLIANEISSPLWPLQMGNGEGMISTRRLTLSHNPMDSGTLKFPLMNGKMMEYINNQNIKNSMLPLVELNGNFYYFEKYFKTNFFKAMQYCKEHGMELLSMETNVEYIEIISYLKKTFPKVEHFWTSGSDLGEEGAFVWLATGRPVNFTNWGVGLPDNSGKTEHCLEIVKLGVENYVWNDRACNYDYNFICEVEG